jgi:photosystem II stability/assembly factor-like uncharacterized protein
MLLNATTKRLGRILVTASLVGVSLLPPCRASEAKASTGTGFRSLDDAAIAVRHPDKVFLIAITRVGSRLVAVGEHGVIIYSDDSGLTWRQASVPVTLTLTSIAFVNRNDGWAAGHYGAVLHTTDGGTSWQLQLTGIQVNNLTLEAARAKDAETNDSNVGQLALRRATYFIQAGPDKPFLSILASDPNNAIVFGAYRMAMKTTDGGKTWVDWSLHIGDSLSHNLYDVITVGTDVFIAGEIGLVFCSTDGGNSFVKANPPTGATMLGAIATGNDSLLVFGVAGQAFKSNDVGKTWTSVSFGTGANLTAARRLTSGAIVVASEDGSLYISDDEGNSFNLMPQRQSMALYDLVQAPNGDVVAVGDLGVVRIPASDFNTTPNGE